MKRWKKNGRRTLVLFLLLGLMGGMIGHPGSTAAAADMTDTAKDAAPEITNSTPGGDAAQVCSCTAQCAAGTGSPDCPVCQADPSACSGVSSDAQTDESKDADAKGSTGSTTDANTDATADPVNGLPAPEQSDTPELAAQAVPYAQIQRAATDDQLQGAWDAMTAAMMSWDAEVDLSSYNLTQNDMDNIWPNVAQNNPDLFYVLGCYYTYNQGGIVQKCQFTYNNTYDQNSVAEYKAAIDRVFAEVIEAGMSNEQKATVLHDYLIQHMVYDQNANNNLGIEKRNAYEALVNGIGVCEGYTLAYAALLEKAGIEVDYCRSAAMNHIWNYVKLDGEWYHADLTYDDLTASSHMGETGYVQHSYFLLSDDAMSQTQHSWDANSITCSSKKYDNSWHKTAPLKESAIYTVNGASYYLKSETVVNAPNICRGASLIKRDASGAETITGTFEIENLGNGWPMYQMCFSRLSCSRGTLYFNVGNSVYSFNPSVNTAPVKIYQYSDASNRIVSGLLAGEDEMTLEIFNAQTSQIEKIKAPLFTLTASATQVKTGYTKAPVLTANPLASGFIWSKQRPDGGWDTISGANGSSYTIEKGLPEGSYRYRVEATLDGQPVSAEIIITVTAQEEQKDFAFAEATKTVSYGDPDFTITAQGAAAGATVTYSSSDPSVASVDAKTGTVRILKAGSTVITATASETDGYLEAKSTYSLTVSPKTLTWDVSALEAMDRLDSIKGSSATLYGELKLTGILEKDLQTVRFECPASKLSGVYETVAEGYQKVTLSWKDAQDEAALQGDGKENYRMPAALPEIVGRISTVTDSIQESPDGTVFKVQIENGISKVPDSFKDKEHLNTPGKIEKEMRLKIQERSGKIAEANIVVYDVELLINVDGLGWQKATKEDFPSDGLTLTLSYPSGTGKDTHDFTVAHMFTTDMNGFQAGDVEYPAVTKSENGITFKVYGLSPISIGWEEINGSSGSSGTAGSGTAGTGTSAGNKTKAPLTGDSAPMMLYLLLAAASLTVIARLISTKKVR